MITEHNIKYYKKKKEIIKKTIGLFQTKDFNSTSVQEIVDKAEIPKGSFYNYFESKEVYAEELLKYYVKILILYDKKVIKKVINPIEKVKLIYKHRMAFLKKQFHLNFSCLINTLAQDLIDSNEPFNKEMNRSISMIKKNIILCLNKAYEQNLLRSNFQPDQIADILENSWRGTLIMLKIKKNKEPFISFENLLELIL